MHRSRYSRLAPPDGSVDVSLVHMRSGDSSTSMDNNDPDTNYAPLVGSVPLSEDAAAETWSLGAPEKPYEHAECSERKLQPTGWRKGALTSVSVTSAVFIINIIAIIRLSTSGEPVDGISTMYQGSCNTVDHISMGIHFVINILGSILLAASNYMMQCLSAPTRAVCDRAHARGHWVDIGVQSLRNLFFINRSRALLWILLCLNSLPIHLLYNSVVFKVLVATEFDVVVANYAALESRTFALRKGIHSPFAHNNCTYVQYGSTNGVSVASNTSFDVLSKCHLSDCFVPTSLQMENSSSELGNSRPNATLSDLVDACQGSHDCFSMQPNGSTSALDLTSRNIASWPIWSSCHFSDCTLQTANLSVQNPTYSESTALCFDSPPDFFDPTSDYSAITQAISRYQASKNSYVNLTLNECIGAYSQDFNSQWSDVFFITSNTSAIPSAFEYLNSSAFFGVGNTVEYTWLCDDVPNAEDWGQTGRCSNFLRNHSADFTLGHQEIEYCLAESSIMQCKVQSSTLILAIVIACNALKAVCMLSALFLGRERGAPFVVVGDAVASYLQRPDTLTKSQCLATGKSVSKGRLGSPIPPTAFTLDLSRRLKMFRAADKPQLIFTLTLILVLMVAAVGLTADSVHETEAASGTIVSLFALGIGAVTSQLTSSFAAGSLPPTDAASIIAMAIFTNVPQLLVSLAYVMFHGVITGMLLAYEWSTYAIAPKALRTSRPVGQQRSTYALQVPLRYSIPLIVIMAVLHWLISSSLFLVRVNVYYHDRLDLRNTILGLGFSPLAMVLSAAVGALLLICLMIIGFRRLKSSMPIVGSNSWAIAAACHPPEHDTDAALKPVQWGETNYDEGVVGHCSFSSMAVTAPVVERLYS